MASKSTFGIFGGIVAAIVAAVSYFAGLFGVIYSYIGPLLQIVNWINSTIQFLHMVAHFLAHL